MKRPNLDRNHVAEPNSLDLNVLQQKSHLIGRQIPNEPR